MNKKKLAKSVVGIALIVSVAILIVVCVGKIKHIQNKKNIIGTWKNANAEEVFTFQENGGLVVNKDMPELGITCGNALYSISSSNMIFVEQRDNSVNFEIEVDQNELTIFFMGHKSITIKYRADESLVISIVSYRLYFIIYGRAKEISYFIEILLTDFFSFLCSFIKCYTIPYSSHSPNLAFLNQDTNGHILVDCQSPVHPTFVES